MDRFNDWASLVTVVSVVATGAAAIVSIGMIAGIVNPALSRIENSVDRIEERADRIETAVRSNEDAIQDIAKSIAVQAEIATRIEERVARIETAVTQNIAGIAEIKGGVNQALGQWPDLGTAAPTPPPNSFDPGTATGVETPESPG